MAYLGYNLSFILIDSYMVERNPFVEVFADTADHTFAIVLPVYASVAVLTRFFLDHFDLRI